MNIIVLKFGGTSLATQKRREAASSFIIKSIKEGYSPVVIVSAMGRFGDPYATDTLINLVDNIDDREFALLTSCGEIISSVIISSMLQKENIKSIALTGIEAGIFTTGKQKAGKLLYIDPSNILNYVNDGYIPIIAGFQGQDVKGRLSLLDRGGSDITAAAVGAFVKANKIKICTDVPGVMTADPTIIKEAQLIKSLSYDSALLLSQNGAKIIHADAVVWAKKANIPLYIFSIDSSSEEGTVITHRKNNFNNTNFSITTKTLDEFNTRISVISDSINNINIINYTINYLLDKNKIDYYDLVSKNDICSFSINNVHVNNMVRTIHHHLLHSYLEEYSQIKL
jgi:aspartate kinase